MTKRDFEFAKKYGFKIIKVIESCQDKRLQLPYIDIGNNAKLINSGLLNNLSPIKAREKIVKTIVEKEIGQEKTVSKLRDWGFLDKDTGGVQSQLYIEKMAR